MFTELLTLGITDDLTEPLTGGPSGIFLELGDGSFLDLGDGTYLEIE